MNTVRVVFLAVLSSLFDPRNAESVEQHFYRDAERTGLRIHHASHALDGGGAPLEFQVTGYVDEAQATGGVKTRGQLHARHSKQHMFALKAKPTRDVRARPPPDVQTLTVAYMLMGAVTFVMALFYLVQSPDLDIRFYTWDILRLAASFFVAVLTSDIVNSTVVEVTGIFVVVNPVMVDILLACIWFMAAQIVTAILTGALEEEVKNPEEATSDQERKQLEAFWEHRQMSVECWGGLVAHCGGFAGLRAFTTIQDLPFFSSSTLMSLVVVPLVLITVILVFRVAALIRYWISLMDDGKVTRSEILWNHMSEEAENEALCLCLSFALVRSASFFFIGAMPNVHFDFGRQLEDTMWTPFAAWAGACMVAGLLAHVLKERLIDFKHSHQPGSVQTIESGPETAHEPGETQHTEDNYDSRKRVLTICSKALIMVYAWGMVTASTICMNKNAGSTLAGHVKVALAVSFIVCVVILCLDKVADNILGGAETDGAMLVITHMIMAHGLLIGISWEVCFFLSMRAISDTHSASGERVNLIIGIFLCIVVVPAYRFFMLPESKIRKETMLRARREIQMQMSK